MRYIIIFLLLLSAGSSATESVLIESFSNIDRGVNRVRDNERGVTCYVFYGGTTGGISCIPDSNLQARNERNPSPHEQQPEPIPAVTQGGIDVERWVL